VIISHQYRFIFIKTRKTASTSVEIALSQFVGQEGVITTIDPTDEAVRADLGFRGPQNLEIPLGRYTLRNWAERLGRGKRALYYNHMPAREIRATVGRRIWKRYYRFCFERNPWDRALSLYYWRTQHIRPRPSLLDFLHSVPKADLSNWNKYTIWGKPAVDRICLYESLQREMESLRRTLGLPSRFQVPHTKHLSRADRRPYQAVMGPEEREIVAGVCAREIALLGYTFG
jgi:hypothetical protein